MVFDDDGTGRGGNIDVAERLVMMMARSSVRRRGEEEKMASAECLPEIMLHVVPLISFFLNYIFLTPLGLACKAQPFICSGR